MSQSNLGTAVANAVMQAAAEVLRAKGLTSSGLPIDLLVDRLRKEAKQALSNILDQTSQLTDGGKLPLPFGAGEMIFKVECVDAARKAVTWVVEHATLPGFAAEAVR